MSGERILGNVGLFFDDPVENKDLEIIYSDRNLKKKLTAILANLSISYNVTEEILELGASANDIVFPPNQKLIGFQAEKNIQKVEVLGTVFGFESGGSLPTFPYIDIGDDGEVDWLWLGSITSWGSQQGSADLHIGTGSSYDTMNENKTYLCGVINFPKEISKINISAHYEVPIESDADVKATVLVPGPLSTQFKANQWPSEVCDLQEGGERNWRSCTIDFENSRIKKGKHLVCVYADSGSYEDGLFTISRDPANIPAGSISAATCILSGGEFSCGRLSQNYYITASQPNYDGKLGIIQESDFAKGYTGVSTDKTQFQAAIENALGANGEPCREDDFGNCVVPIEIGSQSSGKLALSGLRIEITKGTTRNADFKELTIEPEIVTRIGISSLEDKNYTLTVPLSLYENLTAPEIEGFFSLPFQAKFDTKADTKTINVFESTAIGLGTANEIINETLKLIQEYNSDFDKKRIITFLGIDLIPPKTELELLKNDLLEIESNLTMPADEKEDAKNIIRDQAIAARQELPEIFFFHDKVDSLPAIPPTIIDRETLLPLNKRTDEFEEYLFSIQSQANMETLAQAFKIKKFSGEVIEKTFIMREIITSLPSPFVAEEIPGTIAAVSSDILYDTTKIEVLTTYPILLKQNLASGTNVLAYMLNGNVIGRMGEIKTLVVSVTDISGPGFEPSVCGDGTCTAILEDQIVCPEDCTRKIPWVTITIILIVMIAGIYYINFYKGVGNIRSVVKKNKLFNTETDKINLIKYIEKAQQTNSQEKLTRILLSKGWSMKQIEYALKKVQKK